MTSDAHVVLVLNCPKCGRSGEATISDNVSPAAGHPDFIVRTISPEFRVIDASMRRPTISSGCDVLCRHCGAQYVVSYTELPIADCGSVYCEVCRRRRVP